MNRDKVFSILTSTEPAGDKARERLELILKNPSENYFIVADAPSEWKFHTAPGNHKVIRREACEGKAWRIGNVSGLICFAETKAIIIAERHDMDNLLSGTSNVGVHSIETVRGIPASWMATGTQQANSVLNFLGAKCTKLEADKEAPGAIQPRPERKALDEAQRQIDTLTAAFSGWASQVTAAEQKSANIRERIHKIDEHLSTAPYRLEKLQRKVDHFQARTRKLSNSPSAQIEATTAETAARAALDSFEAAIKSGKQELKDLKSELKDIEKQSFEIPEVLKKALSFSV